MDAETRGQPLKRAVVEVLGRDGHARQVIPVWDWPVAIGRGIACDVVLDDPFVAARHAELREVDGGIVVAVGAETRNGVRMGKRHLGGGQQAALVDGADLQFGSTRLRVRRAGEPLAAERLLQPEGRGRVTVAGLGILLLASIAAEQWIRADPGGRSTDYIAGLLSVVVVMALWAGLWSVASRLVHHRFDYWRHVRVATGYMVLVQATGTILPIAAFALGWAFLSRINPFVTAGIAWALVLAHLVIVLPSRRRLLAWTMASLFVLGSGLYLARTYQVRHQWFNELYVSTIAPPGLRLAAPVSTRQFIEEARDLKAAADARTRDDDGAPDEEGEDF